MESNEKIGFVYQHNDLLWDEFTVKQHLDFYSDLLDCQIDNHFEELLQILGLTK